LLSVELRAEGPPKFQLPKNQPNIYKIKKLLIKPIISTGFDFFYFYFIFYFLTGTLTENCGNFIFCAKVVLLLAAQRIGVAVFRPPQNRGGQANMSSQPRQP
jgi:hypothetical protein